MNDRKMHYFQKKDRRREAARLRTLRGTGLEDADLMPFGKHTGKRMDSLPPDYLKWIVEKFEDKSSEIWIYAEARLKASVLLSVSEGENVNSADVVGAAIPESYTEKQKADIHSITKRRIDAGWGIHKGVVYEVYKKRSS